VSPLASVLFADDLLLPLFDAVVGVALTKGRGKEHAQRVTQRAGVKKQLVAQLALQRKLPEIDSVRLATTTMFIRDSIVGTATILRQHLHSNTFLRELLLGSSIDLNSGFDGGDMEWLTRELAALEAHRDATNKHRTQARAAARQRKRAAVEEDGSSTIPQHLYSTTTTTTTTVAPLPTSVAFEVFISSGGRRGARRSRNWHQRRAHGRRGKLDPSLQCKTALRTAQLDAIT